jgi:hypothetical protein
LAGAVPYIPAKAASEKPDDSGFAVRAPLDNKHLEKGETKMGTKIKQQPLHIAVGYTGLTDSGVAANALAAHDGVKAHPELFPNPPDLDVFMTNIQLFEGFIAAAQDGGKKAVSQKNKQRVATIKLMRQLGHYVEANCKDDVTIVNASGYKVLGR